jgi:hypothetical protein
MHALSTRIDVRHALAALAVAVAIFAAVAAIPSGASDGGLLANVAPQSAEAFDGGFDGDHAWVKVSAGDIAGGVAQTACRTYAGPVAFLCPWFAQRASEIVGSSSGVWAELYTNGNVNIGTW